MKDTLTEYKELWSQTLDYIRDLGIIQSTSFESWLLPLKVVNIQNDTIFLGTQMQFIKEWVENYYRETIETNLKIVSNSRILRACIVLLNPNGTYTPAHDQPTPPVAETPDKTAIGDTLPAYQFNPKYTFDSFVVGNSNMFAHAAALAVAEVPGKAYNPLFLMGGVGLGKTHLMHAIAQFILEHNPHAKIAYFSTEKFVNDWIAALSTKTTEQFRLKYRYHDVILIDDIQFLANKVSSQEELFHTYNALYDNGSQIIISSDRPPREIASLEERLVSRFSSGLTVDIAPPDLETRIAILQKKAKTENIIIDSPDILFYIANQVDSNIRVLEGAFNRVIAFARTKQMPVTIPLAAEALKNFLPENKIKIITIELIQQVTTQYFHLNSEDMKSQKRNTNISYPRQIAMYLSRDLTDTTFEKIGEEFGNRHYSTVIHAHDEIAQKMKSDPKTAKAVADITSQIKKM